MKNHCVASTTAQYQVLELGDFCVGSGGSIYNTMCAFKGKRGRTDKIKRGKNGGKTKINTKEDETTNVIKKESKYVCMHACMHRRM